MPIPLQALYYLSQQIAKRFVEILSKTVGWCVIHGRLVLLELKLLALGHQTIVEWLTVIRDDIARDTILIDQVSRMKFTTFSFFTSLRGMASAHLEK